MLQALGSGKSAAIYLAVAVLLKTALQALLLPVMGIVAAPLAQLAMYILAAVLAFVRYVELVGKNGQIVKSVSKIALGGVIMSVCIQTVALTMQNRYLRPAVGALVGAAVYLSVLVFTKAFGEEGLRAVLARGKGERND